MLPSNSSNEHLSGGDNSRFQSLQFAVHAAGIGIWDVQLNQTWIVTLDERCRELLGLKKNGLISYDEALQLIHPDDHEAVDRGIKEAVNSAIPKDYDLSYRTVSSKNDPMRWLRSIGKAFFNDDGVPERFSGITMDITEQTLVREKAAVAERLANVAIKGSGIGLFHINTQNNFIEYSPAFARILTGEANTTLTREDLIKHIYPEDQQIRARAYESNAQSGELYYEARTVWHDGTIRWVRTIGTAVLDENKKPLQFSGTVQDITEQKEKELALKAAEDQFRAIFEQAPVAISLLNGEQMIVDQANDAILKLWGKSADIIGLPIIEAIPEIRDQGFLELLENVYTTGIPYYGYSVLAKINRDEQLRNLYFDFVYTPIRSASGRVTAIMVIATEVTTQVTARKALEESELFTRSIIYNSPVAKIVFIGEEMLVDTVNENMLNILGRGMDEVVGRPFMEACPELKETPIMARLRHVLATGETYHQPEEQIMVMRLGKPYWGYYSYIYKALTNTEGVRYGVMGTASEITDHVRSRMELEASQHRLRSLVESAPFPIGVYTGKDMIIELANQAIIDVFGKGNNIIGKSYKELLPELENQAIFRQLEHVYTTGEPFSNRHQQVDIETDSGTRTYYFNYDFTPLRDAEGQVYGVMNTAADVTDLVSAKQMVEQTEASLRGAIELAELGTWNYDVKSGLLYYSERLNNWFGFSNGQPHTTEKRDSAVRIEDHANIHRAMQQALREGSDGVYDVEYTVINAKTGRERILHAQGKTLYNEQGKPYKVTGTAQDVTSQRRLQLALEQQVQERTEELQTVNEELVATNEELHETNDQLQHSNEELAQYAYVASHDLQEPLRKIRMFSDMLGNKPNLAEDHRPLVDKISQSSERMTLLIRDLLEFSRLLKSEMAMRPINLSDIISAVADDFELTIKEKNARLEIGPLPTIEAVSLQMNQLFYNLLSNALKFTKPEVSPLIKINSEKISHEEAAGYIPKAHAQSNYYKISFADNGIGFDSKYSEQIFEVFKRLHGKDLYPGSGIGLALCRRIVANHNGYLFTESQRGIGATFYIILPDVHYA